MSASIDAAGDRLRGALFSPRTIALVGASPDTAKNNSRPQRFLRKHGYTGRILPINPGRSEILGEQAYPDLRSAPGGIDHAFIMVPAAAVPGVVDQCCELKIPVATIFSAGFAELGAEGAQRQRDMVARARAAGLRLLGPNCMGLVNVQGRTPLTVNAVIDHEPLRPGPLSVVSQSGSMIGSLLTRAQARGLGFSKLVSVGNECDLGVGELADMLVDDPDTGAILLFLETFRDAAQLARAARRAYDAGKPVIAYKLGRSGVGRAVATSHTGAMTGPDEIANAFFREHGIIRVGMIETLFETARLVLGHKPPKQRRVAVVTGTGGAAAMVVDRLGVLGAEVVPPSDEVIAKLAGQDIHIAQVPLTDIPMGRSEGGRYTSILSELLASDHCDAVVSVIGSSSRNPQVLIDRVLSARHRDNKPLAVFLAPRADEGLVMLEENAVASFRTPESCADAVHAYLDWQAPAERVRIAPAELARTQSLLAKQRGLRMNERDACALFGTLGIASVQSRVLRAPADCSDLAGPLAVKILSADIPHKSDAGLVKLDVAPSEASVHVAQIIDEARRAFPRAKIDGVLVQQMERGMAEAIVGFRRDPEVGPVVVLGAGGIAAELRRSYCVRLAPVTLEQARAMIADVRELALIRGYRGLPRGDVEALARAIRAMSLLAALYNVSEAEINPLLVREEGKGVVAVDGLVVMS